MFYHQISPLLYYTSEVTYTNLDKAWFTWNLVEFNLYIHCAIF